MPAELTDRQIDDVVYACRQAGADSTYDIVRACLALATTPPAQGAEPVAAWMSCETRRPWVVNGLRSRASELRASEKRARAAFRKDFMGEPSRYFAGACGEAAAIFEARLAALQSEQAQAGKEPKS